MCSTVLRSVTSVACGSRRRLSLAFQLHVGCRLSEGAVERAGLGEGVDAHRAGREQAVEAANGDTPGRRAVAVEFGKPASLDQAAALALLNIDPDEGE